MTEDFHPLVVLVMLNVVKPDAVLAVESETEAAEEVMVQHTGWESTKLDGQKMVDFEIEV